MVARSSIGEARVDDGTTIAYAIYGEGGRRERRLVLIHSLAMSREFWEPVITALAGDVRILAYDCRGHGRSAKPPGPYCTELFADDLAALLRAVGWDAAVVAGASMGGSVALAFAARHARCCRGLGLIDTTAYYGDQAPSEWEGRAQRALSQGFEALLDFQKTRWFSDAFCAAHPDVVDFATSVFRANDRSAYAEACRMLGAMDLRPALPRLEMPVRIVVGKEDYATPLAMASAMHAAIPHSTLTVIGARHLTPLEAPGEVAAALEALLAQAAGGA